jgi:pyruvate,water dikinase
VPKYILWFDECDLHCVREVGGKAANLGEMVRAGIRVPPGFAVTKDAYQMSVVQDVTWNDIEGVLNGFNPEDLDQVASAGKSVRELIHQVPLPLEIEECIRNAYAKLSDTCGGGEIPVAVRSSATAEDLAGASFAGQQETFLWVRGADEVVRKTVDCWVSLFTDRAISYRAKMGFPGAGLAIAVAIQEMVSAKSAGVMFTIDPITGDPNHIVIEANWGLGESIVQGMVTPDHFEVDKVTGEILKRQIGDKTQHVTPDEHGTRIEMVPRELQEMLCLTDEEIMELKHLGVTVEQHYGAPEDIEWAIDTRIPFPGNVFLLQARPVTVVGRKPSQEYGKDQNKDTTDHLIDLMLRSTFRR